jgi:nicotinamide phosphoribosyltransferase
MRLPIIYQADSYKFSHYEMFPEDTILNNSYIESRGIDRESGLPQDTEIVFFGLQAYLRETLTQPITERDVSKMERLMTQHGLPFNREGWDIILHEYNGFMPVVVEAIPEGTPVKPHMAMVQVYNTDHRLAWAASFVETSMLRAIWYPTTVATLSRAVKKVINRFNQETSDNALLDFQLHDFGARGVSSSESAQLGGLGHLVNFKGTDTVEALLAAQVYYDHEGPAGFSVPAAEHSTIISWGKENELEAYRNAVTKNAGKIVSVVSDSWDIYNAVDNLWPQLRNQLREDGTTLVVRPDSGDPAQVCVDVAQSLARTFGSTVNSKGYNVLQGVRIIQGDGVNLQSIHEVLDALKYRGFASENMVFGMGGALLQKVNRDTLKFAMKTSLVVVGNEIREVQKTPVGDMSKASRAGIQETMVNGENILRPVFINGEILRSTTLEEVRSNAAL